MYVSCLFVCNLTMSSGKRPALTTSETVKERLMKLIFQPKKKANCHPENKKLSLFVFILR